MLVGGVDGSTGGGIYSVDIYSLDNMTRHCQLDDLPLVRRLHGSNFLYNSETKNNPVLCSGGDVGNEMEKSCMTFDLLSGKWIKNTSSLPERIGGGLWHYEDKIFMVRGGDTIVWTKNDTFTTGFNLHDFAG